MFLLKDVIPLPLKEQNVQDSQIWKTTVQLDATKRYFTQAPSGKGKTTLQLLLYGIRKDYEGSILVDQTKNIRDFKLNDWAEIRQKRLAIIFQDLRLFPQLSVQENLMLKNQLTSHRKLENIKAMAEALGVLSLWDKKAGILSYGQKQRVAIIRALCQPFDFLLMDEPFAHLDQENIEKCCNLIMESCKDENAGYMIASLGERYSLNYDEDLFL